MKALVALGGNPDVEFPGSVAPWLSFVRSGEAVRALVAAGANPRKQGSSSAERDRQHDRMASLEFESPFVMDFDRVITLLEQRIKSGK